MNIQLSNTEEFIDNKSTGSLGQVLIRLVGLMSEICSAGGGEMRFLGGDADVLMCGVFAGVITCCGYRARRG